ncbi:MAG: glycosyltransferase family 4 protein [Bacillota bacterium]
MRVAVFTDSYEPYVSGVVRSIQTFARELAALGCETFIFAPAYPGHRQGGPTLFRFASLPAPTHPQFRLAIPLSWRLGRTLRELRCDLVHVHSPFLMGMLGAHYARRLGLPLVFTFHTFYHQYVHYAPLPRWLTEPLTTRWVRDFAARCDLVVAPSTAVASYLRGLGVEVPVEVIPTGVDVQKFSSGRRGWLRKRLGLGPEVPVALYAGRLGREKNLDLLLDAFRLVEERCPDCRLALAGDGPLRPHLEARVADLGLGGRVHFLGAVPPEAMADCYAGADLFVFASTTETQGLVILEAMAAGLPVVAVAGPGVEDVVTSGSDGLLVPPAAPVMAEAMVRLLTDPARRQGMAAAARAKAAAYSAGAMAGRLAAAYRRLLPAEPASHLQVG